jgi:hypothetical protein
VDAPTRDQVRELETLLAKIRAAGMIELNYDFWERGGAEHASPWQRATMAAELADASRTRAAARTSLDALVAATRSSSPAAIAAWADAHDAYLTAFLDECASRGEAGDTAASVATRERTEWAEVRAGTRAFVDESLFYVTLNAECYRRLFGIDPQTLLRVE